MGKLFDMEKEKRRQHNLSIREKYGLEPEEKKQSTKELFDSLKGEKLKKRKSKLNFSVNSSGVFNLKGGKR